MAKGVRNGQLAFMAIQMERHLINVVDESIKRQREAEKAGKEPYTSEASFKPRAMTVNEHGRCWSY